jgi:NTE family protein
MTEILEQAARALILGGGGTTGIAWEMGLILGLRDGGIDVSNAGLVAGTSAGATVGAQITSGAAMKQLA